MDRREQMQQLNRLKKKKKMEDPFDPSELFCQCFSKDDVEELLCALNALDQYPKYASILINHQERSLKIVDERILSMYPELKERVGKSIVRVKQNVEFIKKIKKSFVSLDINEISEVKLEDRIKPQIIYQIFQNCMKEWSVEGEILRRPMMQVIKIMEKCQNMGMNLASSRILVQGCGMGRIISQIYEAFSPQLIEGNEQNAMPYIFSEYFLSNGDEQSAIFPFVHSFTNNLKTESPYEIVKIKKSANFPEDRIFVNFGSFNEKYLHNSYNDQWNMIISYLCTDKVTNVLQWLQIVYKGLKEGGKWLVVCYSCFEKNQIELSYGEFRHIIEKSQFQVLLQEKKEYFIVHEENSLLKEKAMICYILMQK